MDGKLVNHTASQSEWGLDFYAPQAFLDGNRRIMIGWMYHWWKNTPEGCPFAGALSIPRELKLVGEHVYNYPVEEARDLLRQERAFLLREGEKLTHFDRKGITATREVFGLKTVDILEDTKSMEVFVNGGEQSFTWWLD